MEILNTSQILPSKEEPCMWVMKVLNSYETIHIYMFPESCAVIVKSGDTCTPPRGNTPLSIYTNI